MIYSVSAATVIAIWAVLILCTALIFIPFFIIKKKYKLDWRGFLLGAIVFLFFAVLLETPPKQMVLAVLVGSGSGNWLIALAGALMAGLFEETGRLFAFSVVLKKSRENDGNALMYGIGHAGCEIVVIVMFAMINNLIMASALNGGNTEAMLAGLDESQRAMLEESFRQLATADPGLFFVSIIERIAAMATHISLSVIVWAACKVPGRRWLYVIAVLLHTLLDFVSGICSLNGVPTGIIEFEVYLCSALCVIVALRVWRKNGLLLS